MSSLKFIDKVPGKAEWPAWILQVVEPTLTARESLRRGSRASPQNDEFTPSMLENIAPIFTPDPKRYLASGGFR